MFQLWIHQDDAGMAVPWPGQRSLHEIRGGPRALLGWLETQLGCPVVGGRPVARVVTMVRALERAQSPWCARSFALDAWGTARVLLERRDELRLAGWDLRDDARLPSLAATLAQLEGHLHAIAPGTAERLLLIEQALVAGQRLPPHVLHLAESIDNWPHAWQTILERLSRAHAVSGGAVSGGAVSGGAVSGGGGPVPAAPTGTRLAVAQGEPPPTPRAWREHDASLLELRAASALVACRTIVSLLAERVPSGSRTVLLCESTSLVQQLDEELAASGRPTIGSSGRAPAHPVLQVLPLALALGWDPVDPRLLVDLLSLPIGPIPRHAARRLASALEEEPGLGSRAWQAARADLTSPDRDSDGTLAARLSAWFDDARVPRSEPLPRGALATVCARVAAWATPRAHAVLTEDPRLARALLTAAEQARALEELARATCAPLTGPQVNRLLEAVRSESVLDEPHPACAQAPRWIRSLSELTEPCARLLWLGTSTVDAPLSPWTGGERAALAACGWIVDDGSAALARRRAAELCGLARITRQLVAFTLPLDAERRPHPVWQQACARVEPDRLRAAAPVLEHELAGALERPGAPAFAALGLPTVVLTRAVPTPPPIVWQVDPALLSERTSTSATDLESRLACPLQWTLRYQARLHRGTLGALPTGALLCGRFGHAILEAVLGRDPDQDPALPPPEEAAAQVGVVFDERVARDAASLARPAAALERRALRRALVESTGTLVKALARGGYRIVGMEVPIETPLDGRPLRGFIDCLANTADGHEAIVDLKYGGLATYRERLTQGSAVQLATYARARTGPGRAWPAVAYLVLEAHSLFTPEGSALRGATPTQLLPDAPPIREVWERFAAALAGAEGWMATGHIVARPLQPPGDWPAGIADLVLDPEPPAHQPQGPCRYCDYGLLCGREEVR